MTKKLKVVESTIQPNHKEAEIWVTPTNSDGTKDVRYYNRKTNEWSECGGGGFKIEYPGEVTIYFINGNYSSGFADVHFLLNETEVNDLKFGRNFDVTFFEKNQDENGEWHYYSSQSVTDVYQIVLSASPYYFISTTGYLEDAETSCLVPHTV